MPDPTLHMEPFIAPRKLNLATRRLLLALLDDDIKRGRFDQVARIMGFDEAHLPAARNEAARLALKTYYIPGFVRLYPDDQDFVALLAQIIGTGDL